MRGRHRPRARPRIAASRPLGSRCRIRLSRVSRSGRRAAIDPDLEPLPRSDFRELGREAAPAVAFLQWRFQSGPYFRGEGDSDSPAGWKLRHHLLQRRKLPAWSRPPLASASHSYRPRRPRPPPADVAVARQSPAPPAGALQQRLPTAGSRAPPCQGPCALLTQAWPRSGSSPQSHWPPSPLLSTKAQPPSWSPPLSCPARRCLPLTPALDACRYHHPPMPSSADADVAAFTSAHGPPLRDPSDSYHRQQGPPCQGPGSLVPLQASPPCSNLSS
ncbi:uncharacterized protein LOC130682335 isoform X2 [Manis pentadactyla]|uniref:uncharacterized protein LOC130682335 isoform X2 n=1 Tax=Manis pentadactyla TaxID=143292 RepID=UPI00255C7A8F|nr:uncharacterized protein LOC130682335 isoform X2 [Manis pentadactyla]